MDFLALSQRMVQECGVSGTLSSVAGQQGSLNRCVTWVAQAWTEIQTEYDDWDFMRSSFLLGAGVDFQTVYGQAFYPLGTGAGTVGVNESDFGKWDIESFRTYTTSFGHNDEVFLERIDYDQWRNNYMYGAMQQVRTRPMAIAVGPQQQLCVGPPPNDQYSICGDYFRSAQQLVADSDEPTGLPARFQMIIVYHAMKYYAGYESAPEVYQRAVDGYNTILDQMSLRYAPTISSGGALA